MRRGPGCPLAHGVFDLLGYRDLVTGAEHVALVSPLGHQGPAPLVRLHSECLTGDVFGSQRCDCGPQLERSLAKVAAEGGVVVYLRGHEGRGVGLLNKLQAYELQDRGSTPSTRRSSSACRSTRGVRRGAASSPTSASRSSGC